MKKITTRLLLFAVAILGFTGCETEMLEEENPQVSEIVSHNLIFSMNSFGKVYETDRPGQTPINLVHFIPTDLVEDFEADSNNILRKASDAAIFAQKWYKTQMAYNGYPDMTFALSMHKNKKWAMVIPVYGTRASNEYNSTGDVRAEIEAFYEAYPDVKKGRETMVVSNYASNFAYNSSGPFAFARANDGFDMQPTGTSFDGLALESCHTYGGYLHELGHTFTLQHINCRAPQRPSLNIMGYGAVRWNNGLHSTVFLNEVSAANLANTQAFNSDSNGIDYFAVEPQVSIENFSVQKNDAIQATQATFTFTSNIVPALGWIGHDGLPAGGNSAYDDVPFSSEVIATGNPNEYAFSVTMPYADYFNEQEDGNKDEVSLSANLIFKNGTKKTILDYIYTITGAPNQIFPDDNINYRSIEVSDRSGWAVTTNTFSGTNAQQEAGKIVDSDFSTYWQSTFPYNFNTYGPHMINIDMGTFMEFDGLYINADRSEDRKFYPEDIKIEISNNGGIYSEVASERLPNRGAHFVEFGEAVVAKYIRLTVTSINATNGVPNLNLAEVDILNGVETDEPADLFSLSNRSAWTVTTNTSTTAGDQQPGSMIDSNTGSFWQSLFPYRINERGPHIINVDMASPQNINGVYIDSFRDDAVQFWPQHVIVETSSNGVDFQEQKQFDAGGTARPKVFIGFENEVNARYLRIKVTEVYKNQSFRPDNMVITELDVF